MHFDHYQALFQIYLIHQRSYLDYQHYLVRHYLVDRQIVMNPRQFLTEFLGESLVQINQRRNYLDYRYCSLDRQSYLPHQQFRQTESLVQMNHQRNHLDYQYYLLHCLLIHPKYLGSLQIQ